MKDSFGEECLRKENLREHHGKPHQNQHLDVSKNEEIKKQYVAALINEIKSVREQTKDYKVSTIFMGGGTPSILSTEEIERIFLEIYVSFEVAKDVETTIEANPGTVTEEKITAWKKVGINRVSIGLQSANNEELKLLGRIHTFEQFKETFVLLRENGFNLNVDLMSGIPGQTVESYKTTLEKVLELNPEHISAYSLMIEKGTKYWEVYDDIGLPSEETDRIMYEMTKELLEERGYLRYEISNYAKEGFECRHNLGYWDRANYLGLGLGAASLIENTRFKQESDLEKYLEIFLCRELKGLTDITKEITNGNGFEEIIPLSEKEQMEEFMFLGLRKTKGILRSKFYEIFNKSIDEVYGEVLIKLEKESLIEMDNDYIRLTDKGTDVSNYVFTEFI
jgi:oxygen-independent coproporphyrinogen-3 oxidase